MFVYHIEGLVQGHESYQFTNITSEVKLSKMAAIIQAEEQLGISFTTVTVSLLD